MLYTATIDAPRISIEKKGHENVCDHDCYGDDVIVFVIGDNHVFETMFHPGEYDWMPISTGKAVEL